MTVATGTNSRAAFTTASRVVGSWTPVCTSRRGTMGPTRMRTVAMDPIIMSNGLTSLGRLLPKSPSDSLQHVDWEEFPVQFPAVEHSGRGAPGLNQRSKQGRRELPHH